MTVDSRNRVGAFRGATACTPNQEELEVALSEVELVEFSGLGTLEAFLTDGLRSLADTIDCPDMVEKTMRYPGHADLMRAFRTAGLFSKDKVRIGDQ